MAVIVVYVMISPDLHYHVFHLERCALDDPHFLYSSEPG